ncbi:hypothetical protein V7128_01425 [Neobacillus vireti]|uniref:hypothetical protein n=1 Tax=Neobacillus vireti TaxID=220686 RepID=UPI003000ED0E
MYKCSHCKEEFNYQDEVVYVNMNSENNYETISIQQAHDEGYHVKVCVECADKAGII